MKIFDTGAICDNCGKLGSYDLGCDHLCPECLKPEKSIFPEIQWLDRCENCFQQHGVTRDGICVFCGCGPRICQDC